MNKNPYIKVGVGGQWDDLGGLYFTSYTPLRSANGVTGQGVTVTVYGRFINYKLYGPTIELPLQSEWTKAPISATASAVAAAMGKLKDVPIISKFATASSQVMKGVADGARTLGYTNHPVISNVTPIRQYSYPPMSSSEISHPFESLSTDPKNSLSYDNSIIGLSNEDPQLISNIVKKESFIFSTTWNTTDAVDTLLATAAVTPTQRAYVATPTANALALYQTTPMGHLSQLFQNWRGDIKFRIQVVASPFHRGRLRVSWDPAGNSQNIANTSANTGSVFNSIIDIGTTCDVTFTVPYLQYKSWLECSSMTDYASNSYSTSGTSSWQIDGKTNGQIAIRVQNLLSAPVATAPVTILVWVSAGDNFEFANPSFDTVLQAPTVTLLTPQSELILGNEEQKKTTTEIVVGDPQESPPCRYLLNHGEVINNLRQLFHRQYHYMTYTTGYEDRSALGYYIEQIYLPRYPLEYGYTSDTYTETVAKSQGSADSKYFSYGIKNPITWMAPCFWGIRGGFNWTVNAQGKYNSTYLRVNRDPSIGTCKGPYMWQQVYSNATAITSPSTFLNGVNGYMLPGCAGGTNSLPAVSGAVTVTIPQFGPSVANTMTIGNEPRQLDRDQSFAISSINGGGSNNNVILYDLAVGCAPDFTFIYYMCAPTIWFITDPNLP